MKTTDSNKNSLPKPSFPRIPLFIFSYLSPWLVLSVMLLLNSWTTVCTADNTMHDSGVGAAGPGFGPASHEYELAVIQEIQMDGTLLLTNGRKIKIQKRDLQNPILRSGSEIVIFTPGGIYHLDRKGRIVGSIIMLNDPYAVQSMASNQIAASDLVTDRTMRTSDNLASKSAVSPPVGLFTKDTLRGTSLLMNAGTNVSNLHVHSDGQVSGLISIAETPKQANEAN